MAQKYMLNGREVTEAEFFGDKEAAERRFNEMIETQQPPMSNTDREFLEGHSCGSQFAGPGMDKMGDVFKKQAEAAGQSTTGKVYIGGLAAFPGDPEAWVSGRGDVQRVLEQRGWGSEGSVNVKPKIKPPKREKALPKLLEGGAKKQLFKRLKAKGLSGDILQEAK